MKLTPTHIRSYLEQKSRVFSAAKESKDKVRANLLNLQIRQQYFHFIYFFDICIVDNI